MENSELDISTTENIFLKWIKRIEEFGIEIENIKKIFYKMKPLFKEELTLVHMDFRLGNIILDSSLELNIIDFYEFILSVGAISYIYSNGIEKNSFYFENFEYLNRYIKECRY